MSENKKGFGYFLKTGVVLLFIAAIMASMIALVNSLTKDRISENEDSALRSVVYREFGEGCDLEEVDGVTEDDVDIVYRVSKGDETLGYCIQLSPNGFKAEIKVIVLADRYGKCKKVEITSISDTPGVGTKVKDDSFLSAFVGKDSSDVGDCDTIVGATVSSSAVKRVVVSALGLPIFEAEPVPADNGTETLPADDETEPDPETEPEPVDPTTEDTDEETSPETQPLETDENGETRALEYIRPISEVSVTWRETTATETPGESGKETGPVESSPETTGEETAEPVDPSTDTAENTDTPPDETTGPEDTGSGPEETETEPEETETGSEETETETDEKTKEGAD